MVDYARRLGIKSPLQPVPSLCLGSADLSVYELVGAYSAFMNKGVWTEPFYISRIEDKHGNVLQEFPPKKREAVSEKTAYLMMDMLRGTSRNINKALREDNEICGKTGTTSNQSDGWFIGLSRGLCAGAWVGGEDRCIHFKSLRTGGGAKMALPIWEQFMLNVYEDIDLPYDKGTLLPHGQPADLVIPPEHDQSANFSSTEEQEEGKPALDEEPPSRNMGLEEIF